MNTAPPFFLSYSQNDADEHLRRFISELNTRVRAFSGKEVDGYFDRHAIQPGGEWPHELVDALCSSQTLVCLFSPSYFSSKACGKEMQVFLERRRLYIKKNPGRRPANIIPVIWQPCKKHIPPSIPKLQYFDAPSLDPKLYGVKGLLDQEKDLVFKDLMQRIARQVSVACDNTPLPQPSEPPTFGGIRSAFVPPPVPLSNFDSHATFGGPEHVTFVYANCPAWNTCPYAPPDENAMLPIAASVAVGLDYVPSQISFDPSQDDLIDHVSKAVQRNNIVLTLVDGRTLAHEGVRQRLQELDEKHFNDTSTFIVWSEDSEDIRRL